jgi:arsenite/tail-anchored protein-transporting ATPase
VNGFDNLFAMEIDPTSAIQEMVDQCSFVPFFLCVITPPRVGGGRGEGLGVKHQFLFWLNGSPGQIVAEQNGMMGTMMQDLAFAIPGVDEAMSFAEIMKYGPISDPPPSFLTYHPPDTSSRWNTL